MPDRNDHREGGNDTVICSMGSGAADRPVYRVVSYARQGGEQ
jgi:hypothetical protein